MLGVLKSLLKWTVPLRVNGTCSSKKQSRSKPQRGEGHIQYQIEAQTGDQCDHTDQHLSKCRCKQRTCHSMWPEACDERTDDSDDDHSTIHQVGGVVLCPDYPDRKIHPDEEKCCRDRNADSNPVRDIVHLSRYQFIHETSAEQEGSGNSEIGKAPDHFIGELHCQQGQQQY